MRYRVSWLLSCALVLGGCGDGQSDDHPSEFEEDCSGADFYEDHMRGCDYDAWQQAWDEATETAEKYESEHRNPQNGEVDDDCEYSAEELTHYCRLDRDSAEPACRWTVVTQEGYEGGRPHVVCACVDLTTSEGQDRWDQNC